SAVSRQIAALELATGGPLMERLPRGVRLTEEGRCLLAHAEAVLDRLGAAERDLVALRGLAAGQLRVGGFDSADAVLVPRALASFRAAHPEIRLSLLEGITADLLARLAAGEVDVAVVSSYPHQRPDPGQFVLRRLCDDPLFVALPAGHRLAGRTAIRLAALAGESWVEGYPEGSQTLVDACRRAGLVPRIDFAVREWTAKCGLVAAGLGLALVPRLAAIATRPDLVLTPLHPDDAPVRTVYAATRRTGVPSPAVVAFLLHLEQACGELDPESVPPAPDK
ncbi:MAG: LysR substrate-binding domain-containing protein, partial [Natronosporangium sp.]